MSMSGKLDEDLPAAMVEKKIWIDKIRTQVCVSEFAEGKSLTFCG